VTVPQEALRQITVRRDDLEYLLAHVGDEMHGHPDPRHWHLPLLDEAIARLYAAVTEEPQP
jgi:hypothetical protein